MSLRRVVDNIGIADRLVLDPDAIKVLGISKKIDISDYVKTEIAYDAEQRNNIVCKSELSREMAVNDAKRWICDSLVKGLIENGLIVFYEKEDENGVVTVSAHMTAVDTGRLFQNT